ncbi:MAG: Branched-chain-amino-acid aminotransferase [Candidatus Magnetoglobus multicellularis str. Araruama]|uniref:Branched-chain-amino-acid aminotransferase n=1 Tax=Candidatus Magnetoglobus multicellularis str. Araruama TaxID=890399 RepID=A0A1V1PB79_9BACT|nr:MAG: Branched-chain-amino-acid aminotransferase [Candidatus Magnetoglobus multicellularis str. Araruama]
MEGLSITKTEQLKACPKDDELNFGVDFTDYMFNMDYNQDTGWHNARIEPYQSMIMDPSTMVLHYGQAVFEGLKAYKTSSGNIQLFRPEQNFARLNRSCRLLCIPEIDQAFSLNALKELLTLEKRWVPGAPGTSLYIRPTIIATDPFLGVRASKTYRFFIILSPVGAYYPEGFNPVKIWVTKKHVRAVRGGLGEAKTPGNYAASLYAGEQAHKEGYTQVLWLDGVEQQYVEEVGSMNIFFVFDDMLVTPELNGSILPGITRNSVIELVKHWGISVVERKVSIDEVIAFQKQGKRMEIFGTGTAAVVSPVGLIRYQNQEYVINDGKVGTLTQKLYDALTDIQYGNAEDPLNWIVPVCKSE